MPIARLALSSQASPPAPAPVASEPSLRPSTAVSSEPITGTPIRKNSARSGRSVPWPDPPRGGGEVGTGSASPRMRANSASTVALSPPA